MDIRIRMRLLTMIKIRIRGHNDNGEYPNSNPAPDFDSDQNIKDCLVADQLYPNPALKLTRNLDSGGYLIF